MTVVTATISGQWLAPTGDAFVPRSVDGVTVGRVEAATANGFLTADGKVFFKSAPVIADGNGNASVTLPIVPQADISPPDPYYRLVVYPRRDRPELSVFFQLAADTTWDQVLEDAVRASSGQAVAT